MKATVRIFLLVALTGTAAFAGIAKELSADQLEAVCAGRQIFVIEDVEGIPWPRVTIYQAIKASPEEVMAVFFDYKNALLYVPSLLRSDITREVSPCITEVEYGVDVPILADEYYTVRNRLTSAGANSYCVDWKLVKALQTKDSIGDFSVELMGEQESIIRYRNLTTPGSGMAVLLKGTAVERMKQTVQAICAHVQKQKSQNPEQLRKQVETLRSTLNQ